MSRQTFDMALVVFVYCPIGISAVVSILWVVSRPRWWKLDTWRKGKVR